MTKEQIERLNLGVELDTMTELIISTGVDWMKENTTINTEDIDNFPNCAKVIPYQVLRHSEFANRRF